TTAGKGEIALIHVVIAFDEAIVGITGLVESIAAGHARADRLPLVIVTAQEKVDLILFDIDITADIELSAVVDSGADIAVITGLPVFLEYDIQNARCTARSIIFGA